MKKHIAFVLILASFQIFSQELDWKPLSENYSIAVISENKNELLEDSDSVNLEYYQFNADVKFDLNDFHDSEINYNLTLKDLLEPLKTEQYLQFYKNSEYAIKFQQIQDSISIEIYLNDSISDADFNDLKFDLENHFNKENIQFVSKERAKEIAEKELIISSNLFENNIFPASFDVKIKNIPESKSKIQAWLKELEFKEYIDDIRSKGIENFIFLLRIKT